MNAWMDSRLHRWTVGKKSILTSPGVTPCALLLFFILGDVQAVSRSVSDPLSENAALSCFSSSGQPHQYGTVRLHMGSRERREEGRGGGGNDKVTSSKSYSASLTANIMSAVVVRLALLFWLGNAALCAVIWQVYTALHYTTLTRKQTLHELWWIIHLSSYKFVQADIHTVVKWIETHLEGRRSTYIKTFSILVPITFCLRLRINTNTILFLIPYF